MITLSPKQKKALHYLENDPEVEQVLYGGAAFGGKSFLGCYWQLARRLMYPNTRGLIGRSELKNLKITTLVTFWKVYVLHFKELFPHITINHNQQTNVIHFSNGSEIVLMDLKYYPSDPEFTDLGSLELTDAFIDEAVETSEKAFNIVFSRIRHNLIDDKPAILLAANPGNCWVKYGFVMDKLNNPIEPAKHRKYIQAKAQDNPDKDKVERYIKTLERLPLYDRMRLLDGDWSVNENDAPFFYEYNADKHIDKVNNEIELTEPLYLSFDFNLNPTTCILGQKIDGVGLFIYDVIQVIGGTEVLCLEIEPYKDHYGGLLVTGDYSGNTGSTAAGVEGGVYNTDYSIIKKSLGLMNEQFINTKKANSRHEYSRRLCNTVFYRVPLFINPRCIDLINDLQIAQALDNGKLRKDRERFKMDSGDAFRYLIAAWFPNGFSDVNKFLETL